MDLNQFTMLAMTGFAGTLAAILVIGLIALIIRGQK